MPTDAARPDDTPPAEKPEKIDLGQVFRIGAIANELRETLDELDATEPLPAGSLPVLDVRDVADELRQVLPDRFAEELSRLLPEPGDDDGELPAVVYVGMARRLFGWCNGLVQAASNKLVPIVEPGAPSRSDPEDRPARQGRFGRRVPTADDGDQGGMYL